MSNPLSSYFAELVASTQQAIGDDDNGCSSITICADDAKCPTESLLFDQLSPRSQAMKISKQRRGMQRGVASRKLPLPLHGSHRLDRWECFEHPLHQARSTSLPQVVPKATSRWDAERNAVARADSDSLLLRPTRSLVRPRRQKSPKVDSMSAVAARIRHTPREQRVASKCA